MNRLYKTLFFLCFCLQFNHALGNLVIEDYAQLYDSQNGKFFLHKPFSTARLLKREDDKYIEVRIDFDPSVTILKTDTYMSRPIKRNEFLQKFYKKTLSRLEISDDEGVDLDFYKTYSGELRGSLNILSDEQKQRFSRGLEVQHRVHRHFIKVQSDLYKQLKTGDFKLEQKWFSPKPELVQNKKVEEENVYGASTTLTIRTVDGPFAAEKKEDLVDTISVTKDSVFLSPESDQRTEGYIPPIGFTNSEHHINYYPSLQTFIEMVHGRIESDFNTKLYEAKLNNSASTARSNMY